MTILLTPELEQRLLETRLRDLGLSIEGSRLQAGIAKFRAELERAGIVRLEPFFYLSTEWGVPSASIAIGIPFYLARPDLMALHTRLVGFLEGAGRNDLLRYLRHEMGHVLNYGYRLYEDADWSKRFGSFEAEYREEYRAEPFCARFVRHLPGWYAQKHPDEDWAETFGVWMTPGYDWRSAYAPWPTALDKLDYCDRIVRAIAGREPMVTTIDRDDDIASLEQTLREHYEQQGYGVGERGARPGAGAASEIAADETPEEFPPGLDGTLRAIFEDLGDRDEVSSTAARLPAGDLIRRLELDVVANVYRWTGHFPERVRPLVRHLADKADELRQVYPADREHEAVTAFVTMVTVLAMNYVLRGGYQP
jgi:hypothetical protein